MSIKATQYNNSTRHQVTGESLAKGTSSII